MINAKQTFLLLSLVLMAATVPVSAMQQAIQEQWLNKLGVSAKDVPQDWLMEKHGEWVKAQECLKNAKGRKAKQIAQNNIKTINAEAKEAIRYGLFSVQPEELIEVVLAEELAQAPLNEVKLVEKTDSEVSDAHNSGALVLYRDSSEIVNPTKKTIKPIVFDFALFDKWVELIQSSNELPSPFLTILRDNSLSQAPEQNTYLMAFNPEIIRIEDVAQAIEQEIAQEVEIDRNILRDVDGNITLADAHGNIIAQVTDGDDIDEPIAAEIFDNNPPITEVLVYNPPIVDVFDNNPSIMIIDNLRVIKAPVGPDAPKIHILKALNKSLLFGFLGVCSVSALGWKLYQKTSHYQCGLLKKWQAQVADAIAAIMSGKQGNNSKILTIELSQLTRLTDIEREQLAQAHNSLVMAFDKAQQTVVAHAATDAFSRNGQVAIDQIPVVKELKVAHAQWDNVMNDCKNIVEQGSLRLW